MRNLQELIDAMLYCNFRKMHFIVLFTMFPGLTLALIIHENEAFHKANEIALAIHENVAFHKANEIALARSKWLSTFTIDLKP